jgi:hypothetical protein
MRVVASSALALVGVPQFVAHGGSSSGSRSSNIIKVGEVVTEVPAEMNGAGCGIEYIEHEIYGGLSSQLVVGESFEEPHNDTTGISVQWAIGGGAETFPGKTHRLLTNSSGAVVGGARHALNGLQFLQMQQPQPAALVWAQNRGLNMQGLTLSKGVPIEGWLWMSAGISPRSNNSEPLAVATANVSVQLRCGSNRSFATTPALASQSFIVDVGGWKMYNVSALKTAVDCIADGSIIIALHTPGVALDIDMVFMQPGHVARYKGLPVRKDLAEFLLASGMTGMRMGGGTINTWICADGASQPGSGYVLANFRGPRWRRQPLCGQEYPYTSAGWGWVDFINFCEAANLTAALTLSELDDPVTSSQFYVAGVVRQVSDHVCCRRTSWNTCMVLLWRPQVVVSDQRTATRRRMT